MSSGLTYHKLDLHTHTPASKCFGEIDVTADDIVEAALTQGLAGIAITDHNTGEWIDRMKEAAAARGLIIFPSVEISVNPGIHIIALFDPACSADTIKKLLNRLYIDDAMFGQQEALVTRHSPEGVILEIRECNGLPVLAHIDDYCGAWKVLAGQSRIQLLSSAPYAALEFVTAVPSELSQAPYNRKVAAYQASDNPKPDNPKKHSHLGIGSRFSWFKMEGPVSFEGLRQCFSEPDLRIKTAAEYQGMQRHAAIERVTVSGGFLDGLDLEFNENMNALIGGRGAGKSALIEAIRFAFGAECKTDANQEQHDRLVGHVVRPGTRIAVEFRLKDGNRYSVERTADGAPVLTRTDTGQLVQAAPTACLPIEVYGQKEVYEISKDPEFQLRLIDKFVAEPLADLRERESQLIGQLRDNADAILKRQQQIDDIQDKTSQIGALEEELHRLSQHGFEEKMRDKNRFDQEKRLLEDADASVRHLSGELDRLSGANHIRPEDLSDEALEGLPNQDVLRQHQQALEAIAEDTAQTLTELKGRIEQRWNALGAARDDWRQRYETQAKRHEELLRTLQANSPQSADPGRYVRLQQRLSDIRDLQRNEQDLSLQTDKLLNARAALLENLCVVRSQMTKVRQEKAVELNKRLRGNVRVNVRYAGNREKYKTHLGDMLQGKNVRRNTQDQLAAANDAVEPKHPNDLPQVTYRDPIELADAIRREQHILQGKLQLHDGESSPLTTTFGVDSPAMRANIAKASQEELFGLEVIEVPDLPIIQLKVGSRYRDLDQLSVGQRCTAILSLILLESDCPLLIDQPEDDLDNQFIFDQIVQTLRSEKERRQFLIATHNANIPVSGDAELILVMDASQDRGQIGNRGSIDSGRIKDDVERILEGGKTAFKIRQEKYGIG